MHLEALKDKAKTLFPFLGNFPDFYLAGGTGLALQIGHRISVDFDLFSSKEISRGLELLVKKTFAKKEIAISVNNPSEFTVFVQGVKFTFLHYPFLTLLALAEFQGAKLLAVKEIAAAKAYAIGRRGAYKDYIDLYFIILGKYSNLEEIIELAEKKYGTEFNSRLFLEQLVFFDDLENEEIIFLQDEIDRKDLESFFKEQVRSIKI